MRWRPTTAITMPWTGHAIHLIGYGYAPCKDPRHLWRATQRRSILLDDVEVLRAIEAEGSVDPATLIHRVWRDPDLRRGDARDARPTKATRMKPTLPSATQHNPLVSILLCSVWVRPDFSSLMLRSGTVCRANGCRSPPKPRIHRRLPRPRRALPGPFMSGSLHTTATTMARNVNPHVARLAFGLPIKRRWPSQCRNRSRTFR